MIQLIINGVYLPKTSHDKYQCYPKELSVPLEMISGRVVREVRGHVWAISYSYDYMGNELWRRLAAELRAGKPLTVQYLPDNSDSMSSGVFLVESITNPTFAFSKDGVGYWHNVGFTLREVKPHD